MVSFKNASSKIRAAVVAMGASLVGASSALAEPGFTVTTPDIPYEQLGSYTTVILGRLAAMWVIRKLVKTTNRS